MLEAIPRKKEYEGSDVDELVLKFHELMDKEGIEYNAKNAAKLLGMFLENNKANLSEEDMKRLKKAVLLKPEKHEKKASYPFGNKKEKREWFD